MAPKAHEQEVQSLPDMQSNEPARNPSSLRSSVTFHFYTLWLFTVSEHLVIVCPWTAFGIFSALSGNPLTTNPAPDLRIILARLPHIILWMWLNILAFTVSNQRLPNSIAEDAVNKAWRPLPSGRLTPTQARRLLLVVIPTLLIITRSLGGMEVTIMGLILTWMYNDLEGGDDSYITRNLINSLGLTAWSIGTTSVACSHSKHTLDPAGYYWFALEGVIIFTTLHIQDLRDQAGDRIRGRRTVPLVWGDGNARWSIAVCIVFWSFVCPSIWSLGMYGFLGPVILGGTIALRVMFFRSAAADRTSWRLWGFWISSIFLLPLHRNLSVLGGLLP